ncbi:Peptidase M20,ArgE/DapE/ACY1/CPG2/YscS, conserved site,Peptidase M20, dimerisation domain,N-acyl-L- [Cinara cedri]|uniref:N-acyl-aliphatic-L-amino acid amidohydrolase n=1 Tax=Cinara cedri TaxID=506608 RepID=A0A5E4NCJ5_9HEMI|nr:Peptidase M20,ArgE/DapE/ACY1/CPG2/YscS, conserved site,Peptidase M20, dimerisation domain,N-acyl-L- [Cinara cedri]
MSLNKDCEPEAVTNFREYLRIPTVHPDVDYSKCVEFLLRQAQSLNLPSNIYYMAPGKPIVVITWVGQKPELTSILLNSHMDVVPIYPEYWTFDPFSAHKDEKGNIYARGAQDMKCVGIQYLETIRRYLKNKLVFDRTIHISFVPDEETGGDLGMKIFVNSPEFAALNVGFALDEGLASADDSFSLYYGERTLWHLVVKCTGSPGHGSLLHESTAGEKLQYIINKFMNWREGEKFRLKNSNLKIGDVTSINLTMLNGGCQINVVPPELSVSFDIRLSIELNTEAIEKLIKKWCEEAGEGVTFEFKEKMAFIEPTKINEENPWWITFKEECDKMKLKINKYIFPGATDSRYIRQIGIPALGFSPINNTPILLHDHNEFLNEKTFLDGIDIYYNIIKSLASV